MAIYDDKLKLQAAQLALREVAASVADMASGSNISSKDVARLGVLEKECNKLACEIASVRDNYQTIVEFIK